MSFLINPYVFSAPAAAPVVVGTNPFTSGAASSSWTPFSGLDLADCDIAAALVFVRTSTVNPGISIDGGGSSAGWSALGSETYFGGNIGGYGSAVRIFAKDHPTNSETLALTSVLNSNWGCLVYRIAGAATSAQAGVSGTSGNANPPNLDNGASHPTLWLALAAIASGTAPTALPAGYGNAVSLSNSTLATIQVCDLTNTAQSEDPGAFANASARWGAKTIAFYP